MSNFTLVWVGRGKCGCIMAETVDDPSRQAQVQQDIGEMVQQGYSVERVTAPLTMRRCPHISPQEGPCKTG